MKIVALGQALIRHPLTWSDEIRALVAGADAVMCNFEGCIAPPGAFPMKTKTVHPAPPSALPALRDLGVTHLALANNHVWDYGPASVLATRRAAEAAGFACAGAGASLAEAAAFALKNGAALIAVDAGPTPDWAIARGGPEGGAHPGVNPLRLRRTLELPRADLLRLAEIAEATGAKDLAARRQAIGYDAKSGDNFYGIDLAEGSSPHERWQSDPADLARLLEGIEAAKRVADAVIVSLHYHHWSADWQRAPEWLGPIAAEIAAAGATALIAHGPPVCYPQSYADRQNPPAEGTKDKLDAAGQGPRNQADAAPQSSAVSPANEHAKMPVAAGLGNLVFHTARSATYAREGVPVWQGGALILEPGPARLEPVAVLRPPV